MSPFELEIVCTDFIGKKYRKGGNRIWDLIAESIPQIVAIYHETHVFATVTVIRSFHCFKSGSYKFLAEGCLILLYMYKHVPSFGVIHKKCFSNIKQLQLTPFW